MGTPSQTYSDMSVAKRNGQLCESDGHRWHAVVGIGAVGGAGTPFQSSAVCREPSLDTHGALTMVKCELSACIHLAAAHLLGGRFVPGLYARARMSDVVRCDPTRNFGRTGVAQRKEFRLSTWRETISLTKTAPSNSFRSS